MQQHCGVTMADARAGLMDVLQNGVVGPLNGRPVIGALAASQNPGLFDRKVADDYRGARLATLTLDPRMSRLQRPDSPHVAV